jgi:KDO2-lipid IV(A) lauroyltransferase
MFTIRSRFGAVLLERKKLLRALLQRRHLTRTIAMVADQGPALRVERKHWWIFLNQPTSFFTAAAKIAVSQNLPMVFSGMLKDRRGYYTGYFVEIGRPPYTAESEVELTTRYIRLVEENVRRQPSAYLWSHRRWRRQPQPEDVIRTD